MLEVKNDQGSQTIRVKRRTKQSRNSPIFLGKRQITLSSAEITEPEIVPLAPVPNLNLADPIPNLNLPAPRHILNHADADPIPNLNLRALRANLFRPRRRPILNMDVPRPNLNIPAGGPILNLAAPFRDRVRNREEYFLKSFGFENYKNDFYVY